VSNRFHRIESDTVFEGHVIEVAVERYRHADGTVVQRDVVRHPGSVGIVAHDGRQIWLVRQPREAAGEPDLLELPAGKLDVEGEPPLQTAKRELAEEIGKSAANWEFLTTFYATPGHSDERITLYLATDLSDADAEPEPGERIEVECHPLANLDDVIEDCRDSKTLVGLLLLRERLRADGTS
jgi:8-oxo-dGTP pyrophosphatase MutT (NUDIX family)